MRIMPAEWRPYIALLAACLTSTVPGVALAVESCHAPGVHLQILGSGGPELDDGRASSGYLLWQDGRARVLVDLGGGSLLQFERGGARIEDIDLVLLTHLHVDHSADLPVLIKASYFSGRRRELPVIGPGGNALMPATEKFVEALFEQTDGAYRYLGSYLVAGQEDYRLHAIDVPAAGRTPRQVFDAEGIRVSAVPVHHGPVPALAWRVSMGDKVVVFSGDMNGDNGTLAGLARDADLLVAHHAIPEGARGGARRLHMPPSVIGHIAAEAKVKRLLLSHRMRRTLGRESESEGEIRRYYRGPLSFVEDGQCFSP